MGDVLKFPDRWKSAEPSMIDDAGRPMQLYTMSYTLDDRTWSFEVWGYSFEDAEGRVQAIRETLELVGVIVAIVIVPGGLK